jgi:hypothetical protein
LAQKLPLAIPQDLAYAVIQSSEFVNHGLPAEYKDVTLQIYVEAIQMIWYVLVPMSFLGLVASCFVKHYSVRKQKKMRGELPKTENQQPDEQAVVVNIPSKEEEAVEPDSHPNEEAAKMKSDIV